MNIICVLWDLSIGLWEQHERHSTRCVKEHNTLGTMPIWLGLWGIFFFPSWEQQVPQSSDSSTSHYYALQLFIKALVCKWSFLITGSPRLEVGFFFHFSPNYEIASHYNLCSVYFSQDFSLILKCSALNGPLMYNFIVWAFHFLLWFMFLYSWLDSSLWFFWWKILHK